MLSFIDQSILFSPAERILHYSTENPANQPYEITFLNESLAILEQEDFNLRVRLVGNKIPNSERMQYKYIKIIKDGATMPSEADVNAKIQELKDAEQAAIDKKASGKQKLKDLGLDDAEINALIGA